MGSDRVEAGKSQRSLAKPAAPARTAFGKTLRKGVGPRLALVEELGPIIDAVLESGDALMFARTSDGGAVCMTLLRDKNRDKGYAASQEELQYQIDWLKEEYLGG
jgi:hypothetical protein